MPPLYQLYTCTQSQLWLNHTLFRCVRQQYKSSAFLCHNNQLMLRPVDHELTKRISCLQLHAGSQSTTQIFTLMHCLNRHAQCLSLTTDKQQFVFRRAATRCDNFLPACTYNLHTVWYNTHLIQRQPHQPAALRCTDQRSILRITLCQHTIFKQCFMTFLPSSIFAEVIHCQ